MSDIYFPSLDAFLVLSLLIGRDCILESPPGPESKC